jgi:Major capsid protein 13-like
MSIGTAANFVIYPAQFWGGVVETLQQNTEAFNAASNNSLRLVTRQILGDYERESFLKSTASLIAHRNTTSTSTVSDINLAAGEMIGVKINRRLGPVTQTRDSFRKIGVSPDEFSFMLGQQAGPAIAIDYINLAVGAVRAAIQNQGSSLQYDATADTLKTLNHTAIVGGLSKFGDRASRITAFVTHSKPYFDLMKQQIADKLFEVAGATVYAGTIATFGKPVVVVDTPSIFTVGSSTNSYDFLGLVENAVEVAESEERDIISQPVTGQENLVDRIQGEYAFNLRVKGCEYDTTQGINPADSVLYTAATWIKVVADQKEMPGVRITIN